jgi:son of sevenless-like protein
VPLQRNQEYRLSLPYNNTIEVNLHQQQQQQPDLSQPSNWIMEMTEDGTDCYYYNKLTGEMRTTPPTHIERLNNTQQQQQQQQQQLDNDSGDSRNGHSDDDDDDDDDDENDDDSVFSAHDNNDFDFQSVIGNLDGVKISAAGCGYDSNEEDHFHGNEDDDDTSERVK